MQSEEKDLHCFRFQDSLPTQASFGVRVQIFLALRKCLTVSTGNKVVFFLIRLALCRAEMQLKQIRDVGASDYD